MGRNEIRLRRNRLTGKGSERFRNYDAIMERHVREMRMKKIIRVFMTFLVILFLIALIFYISQIEKKVSKKQNYHTEKIIRLNT